MTNPVVTAAEQAAIPTAIASLQAFKQFLVDIGSDPTKYPLTVPPAGGKFLLTLQLQLPSLLVAEDTALIGNASTQADSWIATLKAAQTPA